VVTVPADTAQKTMDRAGIRISINRWLRRRHRRRRCV